MISARKLYCYIRTFLKYCMDTTKVHWENLRGIETVSLHQAVLYVGMTASRARYDCHTATGTREVMVCGNPQHSASST